MRPIDRLKPGSAQHERVKDYLLERLQYSENKMTTFHSRWRLNELRHQAYINLPDYEKALKQMTANKAPPEITSIVVPYSFATVNTICTYLINAFCGRKPMFQLGANNSQSVKPAQYQEIALQHNAEHTRLVRHLNQAMNDGQIYGVSALRIIWKTETGKRSVMKDLPGSLSGSMSPIPTKVRETVTTYEGNEIVCIDPFMFFPDPSVPMVEVNRRGEFVFWRAIEGKHKLLTEQYQGRLKYVESAGELPRDNLTSNSARNMLSGGNQRDESVAGRGEATKVIQVDQGSVTIIPADLGLGPETYPCKWIFTLLNKQQIAQAEPLDYDHDMHPVAVQEPYTQGYGFGQTALADMLAPMQDALSWFVNSHIYNVRSVLNNMFIVDPSRIEIQDFKDNKPGKIIRMKTAAMGQDVRTAVMQLGIQDVTQQHVGDFQLFMRMGDILSGVSDNMRGVQDQGGRKTATEVRMTGEAGTSRLGALARLISAQQVVDLAEQMSINLMQFMSQEFYARIVGDEGVQEANINPSMIVGDFAYPVHDGSLPLDKVAMLDVWKEIFLGISQDPGLRGSSILCRSSCSLPNSPGRGI
jgi:hypothetical protein